MNRNEIELRVVEEKVNVDNLTEREKQIHLHGYYQGVQDATEQRRINIYIFYIGIATIIASFVLICLKLTKSI